MLKAGIAKTEITPPPGSIMGCFPRKRKADDAADTPTVPGKPDRVPRRPEKAHDPLMARVLVLASETEVFALCVADVPHFDKLDVERVRGMVTESVPDLPENGIVLSGTHTHSGPDTLYLFGNDPSDTYIQQMDADIASAIAQAYENLTQVTPFFRRTDLHLTHNRRARGEEGQMKQVWEYEEGVTTGPVDPELSVLCLKDAQGLKAVLFNYTAHALTLGPGNDAFSADYPGKACRCIEDAFPDTLAIFTNGAAGNVHPRQCMRAETDVMAQMGENLAEAVTRAVQHAERLPEDDLHHQSEVRTYAHITHSSVEVTPEIHALRIGPLAIGFVPGEFFVEFQIDFKQKMQPSQAFLVGYTGAWLGYVPTQEAYETGGYGVTPDQNDPPERSRTSLPPGAGEEIIEHLVTLIN